MKKTKQKKSSRNCFDICHKAKKRGGKVKKRQRFTELNREKKCDAGRACEPCNFGDSFFFSIQRFPESKQAASFLTKPLRNGATVRKRCDAINAYAHPVRSEDVS